MATTSEARALPFFTDLYGQPLESGSIYIGKPGLDPVAYPVTVYSDADEIVALAQPIRTVHGHAVSAGAQVHMFCPIPYSITVLDGAGRLVYASLNEVDPALISLGNSSVQSAADLAALRARSGSSSNQVWVSGFGMYVYQPTDTTSPESIPSVIVGSDGSRYYLDRDFLKASWIHINSNNPGFNAQGVFVTWNDGSDGSTYFANNRGSGAGGYVFRNLSADGLTELSRIVFSANGSITTPSGITAAADINSSGNLHAQGGTVFLNAAGDRDLSYSAGPNTYNLPNAPLIVNGSQAVTQATLLSNQQANGVGSVAVGSSSGVNPPTLPGTWAQTGSNFNNVWQYVRVA